MSVAVVVVAYNSGDVLERCLDSLAGEADEIVVVNNGDPVTVDVPLVESGGNIGFGAACNLGVEQVSSDVVVFLNPDTVVRPGAVRTLAGTLGDDAIGAAQARLLLADDPARINSAGNVLHLSGLATVGGYGDPVERHGGRVDIAYGSGAALAIRTALFRELGGFTERYFLYQEDLELCWRVRMHGLRVVLEPTADVLHDYVFQRPTRRKEYYLERNRLVFVLTAYSGKLLALLAPVFVAVELGIFTLALREGWWREKVRGWGWLVANAGWLRERRRRLQAERTVADAALAPLLTARWETQVVASAPGIGALNALTTAWWRVVRVFL